MEKILKKQETITRDVYTFISDDGSVFDNLSDCMFHETKILYNKLKERVQFRHTNLSIMSLHRDKPFMPSYETDGIFADRCSFLYKNNKRKDIIEFLRIFLSYYKKNGELIEPLPIFNYLDMRAIKPFFPDYEILDRYIDKRQLENGKRYFLDLYYKAQGCGVDGGLFLYEWCIYSENEVRNQLNWIELETDKIFKD